MKGGMFFKDNPYKTCDNNKTDWRKSWKSQTQYALYDSSLLYPGGMNWRGAVPTKNRLLDESGNPRVCPESVNKSCEQNKLDWQEYWYPEYSHYIPHMLYPSDKNIKPIPYAIKPPDGKPCTDKEFDTYANTAEYIEFRNQPENRKLQADKQLAQLDTLNLQRSPKPPPKNTLPVEVLKESVPITKQEAIERTQKYEQKQYQDKKIKEKFDRLRKIQIIQSQLLLPENENILIKIIIAYLLQSRDLELKQLEIHYRLELSRENAKLYVEELGKVCDLKTIKSIFGEKYNEILKMLMQSPVQLFIGKFNLENKSVSQGLKEIKYECIKANNIAGYDQLKRYLISPMPPLYLGNLKLEEIEYYLGSFDFKQLLYLITKYNTQTDVSKSQYKLIKEKESIAQTRKQMTQDLGSRQTRKLFSLNEDEVEEQEEEVQQEIASIIVSHNTRIQCLLDAIHQNDNEDKIRFMNCAILKLTVTPQLLHLSMVYQGNLSEIETSKISEERPYYVKEMTTPIPGHVVYPTTTYSLDTYNFIEYLKLPFINKQYTFYVVRHGQGQHNDTSNVLAGRLHMVTDTSLTPEGISQAKIAGQQLYQYLTINTQVVPTYFFVSDLVRTHETLVTLLDNMQDPEGPPIITPRKPIVLPCASELPIKGTRGSCDQDTADSPLYSKLSSENYSKCSVNSDGSLHPNCNPNVDWNTLYLPFYGGKVRGQKDTLPGYAETKFYPLDKNNCRNTSMIALAIQYISKASIQSMGGTRKRRSKQNKKKNKTKIKIKRCY